MKFTISISRNSASRVSGHALMPSNTTKCGFMDFQMYNDIM